MELFEDPRPAEPRPGAAGNAPEFTVSEISGAVRRTIEGGFGLVRVRGEVGRVVAARTGHLYFDLKDERNVLAAVCWRLEAQRLVHRPEEGMEVVATGRLTTFGPQSKYQLIVEDVRPAGTGALMAMLEARRRALAAEGLFDQGRKRRLPFLPEVIGVVTSPSGAVIRDILHRLSDRFPRRVVVWPVAVQGRDCAPQVAAAIEGFGRLPPGGPIPRPDVVIVARGGGSIEDLWGFNEEIVVRAAAGSAIPLIAAVGHETDTTLIDHAADVRAPTPTAAAELAVPVRLELRAAVAGLQARLVHCAGQRVADRRQRLGDLGRALPRGEALVAPWRQRLDSVAGRLDGGLRLAAQARAVELARLAPRPAALAARVRAERQRLDGLVRPLTPSFAVRIARSRERLEAVARRLQPDVADRVGRTRAELDGLDRLLETLGYEATLKRGFAVVWDDATVVTEVADAARAGALELQFRDGRLRVARTGAATRRRPADDSEGQGTLF